MNGIYPHFRLVTMYNMHLDLEKIMCISFYDDSIYVALHKNIKLKSEKSQN